MKHIRINSWVNTCVSSAEPYCMSSNSELTISMSQQWSKCKVLLNSRVKSHRKKKKKQVWYTLESAQHQESRRALYILIWRQWQLTSNGPAALFHSSCLESTARATKIIIDPTKRATLILIHSSKRINLFDGKITNDIMLLDDGMENLFIGDSISRGLPFRCQ